MSSEAFYICEHCREPVVPDDPEVVSAAKQVDTTTFGEGLSTMDGLGAYFHAACFRYGGGGYRLRNALDDDRARAHG